MKVLKQVKLGKLPFYVKMELQEFFHHVLDIYAIPYDLKIGLPEFQHYVEKTDDLLPGEFRTAKIMKKVASNIRTNHTEVTLVYHLSTLCDKNVCDQSVPAFDRTMMDSGYNPELLFGGKICSDGKYTQVAGISFLTSDSHNILYSPIGVCDEEISAPILESLNQNKKYIVSPSGRLNMGNVWCKISDVVVNIDNALYAHYYAAAVEIQSMINNANYVVKDAEEGKKMFSEAGLSERHLLDLYDEYMRIVDALELGNVISHSMIFLSIPMTKITCDVYGEECVFYFIPDGDEEDKYTTILYDSLPETSTMKYLTKLF
ncbi:MAG: hypothetical protein J6C80_02150 [Flavobacteriales bacterium]|nr:hypothetical protein [Flavobacteriales bacterium]